ncbi:MAG: SPW repeat protein [Gallionellaceae bacterium]
MTIRWQDWIDVLLGCWLVVSPWEMEYSLNEAATANACGLGAVLVVFNLISACRLSDEGQEIFNILLGSWLILSPYSLNFAMAKEPASNAIVVGAIVVALAGWQIYDAAKAGKE